MGNAQEEKTGQKAEADPLALSVRRSPPPPYHGQGHDAPHGDGHGADFVAARGVSTLRAFSQNYSGALSQNHACSSTASKCATAPSKHNATASERSGKNLKRFKDFRPKVRTRVRP